MTTLSYWERESFLNYDTIIIGSGIVGLSTACSLLERRPEMRILILERGLLPSGASTRNAGFACFGSLTEILSDLKIMTEQVVFNLARERYDGLQFLRRRLGDEAMRYEQLGGYELLRKEDELRESDFKKVNKLLRPLFGKDVYSYRDELIKVYGFNESHIGRLLFNPFEGQLHSGQMMKGLLKKAGALGASVISGCHVSGIEEDDKKVQVIAQDPLSKATIAFHAEKAIVCTNGFSRQFFPTMDVQPGRGQVILTKPVKELRFRGTFHIEEGYYYFRDIDGRVLFGGGRHLDKETEATTDFGPNEKLLSHLKTLLSETILAGVKHEIEMEWSGIMAFGADKQPIIEHVSPRIIAGVRMGGMGVALGSMAGERIARILLP